MAMVKVATINMTIITFSYNILISYESTDVGKKVIGKKATVKIAASKNVNNYKQAFKR